MQDIFLGFLAMGIGLFIVIRSWRYSEAHFVGSKRRLYGVLLPLLTEYVGIVICLSGIARALR